MHEPGEGLTEVSEKVTDGSEKVQEGEPGEGEVSRKCLGSVWGVSGKRLGSGGLARQPGRQLAGARHAVDVSVLARGWRGRDGGDWQR